MEVARPLDKREAQSLKQRRKDLKTEIVVWLDQFEAREGRPADDADKVAIQSLYLERASIEERLKEFESSVGGGASSKRGKMQQPASPPINQLVAPLSVADFFDGGTDARPDENQQQASQQQASEQQQKQQLAQGKVSEDKFSIEAMRARRIAWMKSRISDIQKDLVDADPSLTPVNASSKRAQGLSQLSRVKSPKAAEKWSMLKASLGVQASGGGPRLAGVVKSLMSTSTPSSAAAFFNAPPPATIADARLGIDRAYVDECEEFLRQTLPPLRPLPAGTRPVSPTPEDEPHVLPPLPPPPSSYFEALEKAAALLARSASLPAPYESDFASEAPKQELLVSHVPASTLRLRESEARAERERIAEEELNRFRKREEDLKFREGKARERVAELEASALENVKESRKTVMKDAALARGELARSFIRAKTELERRLFAQRAFFKERFGELKKNDTAAARRLQLLWQGIPQALEVRVHLLGSVSSKLRRGHYSVLLSMYDRLGGRIMSWTAFPPNVALLGGGPTPESLPAATKPVPYSGKYFDREIAVEQSVYALAPSPADLRPSAVFVFELFEMKSPTNPEDRVVGWGSMPICNPHFRAVHGRFKVPLLRGPMDRNVTKFSSIEARYAKDLSLWLTNMYIEIRHLPRQISGMNGKGNLEEGASSTSTDIEYDHVNFVANVVSDEPQSTATEAANSTEKAVVNKGIRTNSAWNEKAGPIFKSMKTALGSSKDPSSTTLELRNRRKRRSVVGNEIVPHCLPDSGERVILHSEPEVVPWPSSANPLPLLASEIRKQSPPPPADDSDSSDGEDGGLVEDRSERSKLPGAEIMARRTSKKKNDGSNWTDGGLGLRKLSSKKMQALEFDWHTLTDPNEMEMYTMAIAKDPSLTHKPSPDRILSRKLAYLFEELFDDLNKNYLFTFDFFVGCAVFICAIWLRMYFHYMGEWLFLKANGVPLYSFETFLWTITVKYTSSNITDWVEVGVVAIGHLTNVAVLTSFSIFSLALTTALGSFPVALSKFVFYFGVVTMLDPALIFIVDLCLQNYDCQSRSTACSTDYTSSGCQCTIGDSFKLWYRMAELQASGMTGVFYTIVIYAFTTLFSALVLYHYVLYLHMGGRMLDIYKRINGSVDHFFIPDDNEICLEELNYILNRAKNWRAPVAGTARKVHVNEFTVRDDAYPNFFQKVAHIAIFTTEVDGSKTLFRHFMRNANGSIVEIDGKGSHLFSGQLAMEKLLEEGTEDDPNINKAKTTSGEYVFVLAHGWKNEK